MEQFCIEELKLLKHIDLSFSLALLGRRINPRYCVWYEID